MTTKKLILFLIVISIVTAFFAFDLGSYLSLQYLQTQKEEIARYYQQNPMTSAGLYFGLYVLITALSLPAAAVATLAGGAIFGLGAGLFLVSFASTIGATLAFLIARTLLRDSVQNKFSASLNTVNEGIEREGAFYLFGLRLVPLFPFFAVNLLMGLTKMKTWRYFVISQLGMLPGTFVYVNAGTQLGQLDSLAGIASPGIIISFALLGIFPLLAKRLLGALNARKVYQHFDRPKHFDTNMVVIGAGSAGLVTAYIAAATKAKVTLIEKHKMGGDCLNTGCVPSKALIRSAKIKRYIERAEEFGLEKLDPKVNFAAVMSRIQNVIGQVEPHDSVERYTQLGVDCEIGAAKILDPFRVQVNGQTISTKNIVIATGARPAVPNIEGLRDIPYFTSDTIWELKEQPKRLLVIGAGPIGCELAQSFHRLGSAVSLLNRSARVLPKEDEEIAALVQSNLANDGISLLLGAKPLAFSMNDGEIDLRLEHKGLEQSLRFDACLVATGRQANTSGFGLESLDIELNSNGTIKVNEYLQTKYPNIYACGDVSGPFQLTHAASHQAWYVAVNALFGKLKKFKADYRVIPWSTFTDPEVARVGLNENDAKDQGIAYEVTRYDIEDLDRAIADGENYGVVKVLTVPNKDTILGVTIVGHHSGDLIAEFVLAMKHGLGLNKILGTTHIYPTLAESNKYLAGEWKRNHAPKLAMKLLPKFHRWSRGD